MATHSSILAWRIPWTEEPGGLQSTGSLRVGHDWATSLYSTGFPGGSDGKVSDCNVGDPGSIPGSEISPGGEMATHSSTLAWRILWERSLVGYSPWGRKKWDTTEQLHFHFQNQLAKEAQGTNSLPVCLISLWECMRANSLQSCLTSWPRGL